MIGGVGNESARRQQLLTIVEQHALSYIGVEISLCATHDALSKVILDLREELPVNVDLLHRQFHAIGMIFLETSEHNSICHETANCQIIHTDGQTAKLRTEAFEKPLCLHLDCHDAELGSAILD